MTAGTLPPSPHELSVVGGSVILVICLLTHLFNSLCYHTPVFCLSGIVGYVSTPTRFYYCVLTQVLAIGMKYPEVRVFLSVAIYLGKIQYTYTLGFTLILVGSTI